MIDDKSIILFRERLLSKQQELLALEETANDAAKIVELDQSSVGRLSRMDAMQGQAMSLETKRRRQIELQKITAALGRIDNNEFGDCVRCGEPIVIKRLELDPATLLCIDCANKSENVSPSPSGRGPG